MLKIVLAAFFSVLSNGIHERTADAKIKSGNIESIDLLRQVNTKQRPTLVRTKHGETDFVKANIKR